MRVLLAALLSAGAAFAASGSFLLGVDYSKPLTTVPGTLLGIAVAGHGPNGSAFVFVLGQAQDQFGIPTGATVLGSTIPSSYVQELSADGTVIWSTVLGFNASAFAVDSAGGVYLASGANPGPNSADPAFVAKLQPGGKSFAYEVPIGFGLIQNTAIAVDSGGRAYVAGIVNRNGTLFTTARALRTTAAAGNVNAFVLRVNAAGTALDYASYLPSQSNSVASSIGFDSAGELVAGGWMWAYANPGEPFVLKLSADGSTLLWSLGTGQLGAQPPAVAVDPAGDVVVAGYGSGSQTLALYTAAGQPIWIRSVVSGSPTNIYIAGLDAAGNIYVDYQASTGNLPVKDNLATCGSNLLSVFSPAGDTLQSTWTPGPPLAAPPALAGDGSVYLIGAQSGQPATATLTHLAQSASAQMLPLACVTDPVTFQPGGLAPGKIMTLFGDGIGPAQGMHPSVMSGTGYPTELSGVQVTFAGQPAPILYAQSGQTNVVAPWALTAGQTASVCVTYNSIRTNCLDEAVAEAAPVIFMADDTYAFAVNQDGTINSASNPAKPGEYVWLFGTGFGPVNPVPKDGQIVGLPLPRNVLSTTAETIGGGIEVASPNNTYYHVEYAGPAPYKVAGTTQVNVRTEAGMSNITVTVGGFAQSNTFQIHLASQ